ncbi:MAG: CsbD family protein [Syntrophothermus sp.]
MSGKIDEAKGRAKKAAGEIAGNENLKTRGRADKAKGKVKSGVDKAAGKAKSGIRRAG